MKLRILILISSFFLLGNASLSAGLSIIAQEETKISDQDISPKALLRSAKSIYVESDSVYFPSVNLENSLSKNAKFKKIGFTITRDRTEADIIIQVQRVLLTSVFTFRAIDRKTQTVVATGKATSIIGVRLIRSASASLANQFLEQALEARR